MKTKVIHFNRQVSEKKNFLYRTLIAQELAPRFSKWDYMKFENFYTAKKAINRENSLQ